MEAKVVQLRGRGTLTLPAGLRERYGLNEGDPITIVDLDGVIVLAPRLGMVPKLAAEIERLVDDAGLTLGELVAGVGEERQRYYTERLGQSE